MSRASRLLAVCCLVGLAHAGAVNHTIDDAKGDSVTGALPTYSPADIWNSGPGCLTPPCGVNKTNVDVSQVFDGTWHDTTYQPRLHLNGVSIEVSFTGTAVYVYNLVANSIPPTITFTNLSFLIDGEVANSFIHAPESSSTVQTKVLVFSQASLSNAAHTLVIRAAGLDPSLILFDYIEYTQDDSIPPSPSSTRLTIPPPSSSTTTQSTPLSPSLDPSITGSSRPVTTATSAISNGSTLPVPSSSGSGSKSPSSDSGTSTKVQQDSSSSPVPTSSPTTTSAAHSNLSAVAIGGITAGTIMAVFLIALFAYCLYRRMRVRRHPVHVPPGKTDAGDSSFFAEDRSIRDISTIATYPRTGTDTESFSMRTLVSSVHAVYMPDLNARRPGPPSRRSVKSHRPRAESVRSRRLEERGRQDRRSRVAEQPAAGRENVERPTEKEKREEWEEWPREPAARDVEKMKDAEGVWEVWREGPPMETNEPVADTKPVSEDADKAEGF
ncbi:hypothetical protein C8Q80DRAFT_555087 [Daedaleopsis nitida]|nr:hypothetical protein C8Q80DRAFT_555087 [Daedaleopsis nitida]